MHSTSPRRLRHLRVVLFATALALGTMPTAPATAESWTLTLTVFGPTVVPVGESVLLTVRPSPQVPASHYLYVGVVDDPLHWGGFPCGGDGCSGEVSFGSPGTLRFAAYVNDSPILTGTDVAMSNIITITWTEDDPPVIDEYTVTLEASSTNPPVGESVTLTATANVQLDTTPYYLRILSDDGVKASCGTGATCETSETRSEPATWRYWAQIDDGSGADVRATSTDVAITWTAPALEHVDRVAGGTRYETAATLATSRWTPAVPVAFIVTGANYPDALAAVPAAAELGGPVLLTQRDDLPFETASALQTLVPAQIVIVGGVGAISGLVEAQLASYTTGQVTRIAGANRYETAVLLSQFAFPASPMPLGVTSGGVYLASGEGFADALSGAALAAHFGGPLLLTTRDSLPASTAAEVQRLTGLDQGLFFDPAERGVFVFGGTGAVSDNVIQQLYALGVPSAGDGVLRMAGGDRYETSANIAGTTADRRLGTEVVIATGANFPDGLVAGALGQPLLLVPPTGLPFTTQSFFSIAQPSSALILGGLGAVSDAQAAAIDALIAANS